MRRNSDGALATTWANNRDERRAHVWLVDRRHIRGTAENCEARRINSPFLTPLMCPPGDDKVRLHTRGEICAAETATELAIQHVDVMSAKEGRRHRTSGQPRAELTRSGPRCLMPPTGRLRSKIDRLQGNDCVSSHPLNPLNPRRARFERITKILRFANHLSVREFHNAHRVRRLPVVG
jgi:hypothetical protein